jgi:cysteine desulfurase
MSYIYFDNGAGRKPTKKCIDAVNDVMTRLWRNPSSVYANAEKRLLEKSRECILHSLGDIGFGDLVFTSGGCESNTLALRGYLEDDDYVVAVDRFVHPSIETLVEGHDVYRLENNILGDIQLYSVELFLKYANKIGKTPVVSITGGVPTFGTIQHISAIGSLVHDYCGILHVDGVQLLGSRHIDVMDMEIDLLSISGHKIGTPTGIGALYFRKHLIDELKPVVYGTQERGLVAGTENLPYIAAFKVAMEELENNRDSISRKTRELRDYFIERCLELFDADVVGRYQKDDMYRLDGNAMICFHGMVADNIVNRLSALYGICCSQRSACATDRIEEDRTLAALGMDRDDTLSCIRFTFNEENTKEEIDCLVDVLDKIIDKELQRLCKKNPLL